MRQLTPQEQSGAAQDVSVRFTHPAIAQPLTLRTGANQIRWGYTLNTARFPTYRGEVLQILSASIGSFSVGGNTLNNVMLAQIYRWFRTYMSLAGTNDHNQQPVTFTYPERNWQLGLYITTAPGFTLGRDRVATEWTITAEVAQEDKSLLEDEILASLRYPMTESISWSQLPRGIGYVPIDLNAHSSPVIASNDSRVINAATGNLQKYANNIGDSFDSLIAAWSSGDLAHFMFDATRGAQANELSPAEEYWRQTFGTSNLTGDSGAGTQTQVPSGGQNSGNTSLSSLSGTLEPEQVAAVMVAAGFPADEEVLTKGVAISYGESSWDVAADNHVCCVGLFQININPGGGLDTGGGTYRTGTVSIGGRSVGYGELTHDPVLNAKVAKEKYDGAGGWGTPGGNPWQAYGGQKYTEILPTARAAVQRYLANPSRWDGSRLGNVSTGATEPATQVGNFSYPLGVQGTVGQRPYEGTHALDHNWESDNAIDIAVPFGTPVFAVADGTISSQIGLLGGGAVTNTTDRNSPIFSGRFGGNRLHLVIPNNEFYYAHLSQVNVTAGQVVRKGALLGLSGIANSAEHLHFGQQTGDPGLTVGSASPNYVDRHYPA